MKINILLPALGNSGGIDVVYRYAQLLDKKGHDVVIYKEIIAANMHRYSSRFINTAHQVYCTCKALVAAFHRKSMYDRYIVKATDSTVRDADVIVATAWTTAYAVDRLSPDKGEKYYFVQDYEVWDNDAMGKNSYLLALHKIVISSWINDCMKKELGIGPFPIVYNGIDRTVYHAPDRAREQGRQFLMLNHPLPTKGVREGLAVYERIAAKYPGCKLNMFGMGEGTNLPDYVNYYRNPDKQTLVTLYQKADIFLFPSLKEGWGLTPIEAMACGCVVVASDAGCVRDIGEHGHNMLISAPGDVEAMTENVERLLDDAGLLRQLRDGGRRTVSRLDWSRSADKLEEILETKYR